MTFSVLKSKVHQATITQCRLEYEGSITIPPEVIQAAGLVPYERVLVSNIANGARFETYVIVGRKGSRDFFLNGSAARLGHVGDQIIIMAFAQASPEEAAGLRPRIVQMDTRNRIVRKR